MFQTTNQLCFLVFLWNACSARSPWVFAEISLLSWAYLGFGAVMENPAVASFDMVLKNFLKNWTNENMGRGCAVFVLNTARSCEPKGHQCDLRDPHFKRTHTSIRQRNVNERSQKTTNSTVLCESTDTQGGGGIAEDVRCVRTHDMRPTNRLRLR